MRKLLIVLAAVLFICFIAPDAMARRYTLFFVDQIETIGTGEDAYQAYVIGPYTVRESKVVKIQSEGAYDLIVYVTNKAPLAAAAYALPEFIGFNYHDILARLMMGLSNAGTAAQVKRIIGAYWFAGGEYYYGNILEWEAAGKPEPVEFRKYKGILGVEFD